MVPVGFYRDGRRLITCTATKAPKVVALRTRPGAAITIDTETQPPRALLIRGSAEVEIVDGVPYEYLAANRKVGSPREWQAFEVEVRAVYPQMARITILPTWAKLLDFETTMPSAVEALIRNRARDIQ